MKTTLFAMLFFCSAAAFGQSASASFSSEPQPIQIPSHQLRASQQSMQKEESLLIVSSYSDGRGERPRWEVGTKPAAEVL